MAPSFLTQSKGAASVFARLFICEDMLFSRSFCTAGTTSSAPLVSKILALRNPNVSVVPALDSWVEDGKSISYNFFQRMIRSLRERSRYKHALEVSEWMSKHVGLSLFSSSDKAVQLDLIGHVRGIEAAESFFEGMEEDQKNSKVYGALLACYTRSGELEKSSSLVKKMKEMGYVKNPLSHNNMMTLYSRSNLSHKIPELLSEMKESGIVPNHFSYRMCLYAHGKAPDFDSLEKLLLEMEGLPHFTVDWETYTMVANLYIEAGQKEKGIANLKKAEKKVRGVSPAYNNLISLYAKVGSKDEVMRLWDLQEVQSGKHTNMDYKTVLSSLLRMGAVEEAEQLLRKWDPLHFDIKVPNLVIYWECDNGKTERAEALLKEVLEGEKGRRPVPGSWAILAAGYEAEGKMEDAVRCMGEAMALRADNPKWVVKQELLGRLVKWVGENCEVEQVVGFLKGVKGVEGVEEQVKKAVEDAAARGGVDAGVVSARVEERGEDEEPEAKQSTA